MGVAVERLGIIGGSGLRRLRALEIERQEVVPTPFGEPSAPVSIGSIDGIPVVFLPRHGVGHTLPPHRINYRANIWAMNALGTRNVIGVAAVGGITQRPGGICVPHQIIDYTWGRQHTFFESDLRQVAHVDFTEPYCETLRQKLLVAGDRQGLPVIGLGTYGATQGPRLESAAEILRLERDGCDVVGMTGMPEAALARELGLCYACCAVVVNWAAGKSDGPIMMDEIEVHLAAGMANASTLLSAIEF